jgi:putative nucleotidyltransferase with HDIG domain
MQPTKYSPLAVYNSLAFFLIGQTILLAPQWFGFPWLTSHSDSQYIVGIGFMLVSALIILQDHFLLTHIFWFAFPCALAEAAMAYGAVFSGLPFLLVILAGGALANLATLFLSRWNRGRGLIVLGAILPITTAVLIYLLPPPTKFTLINLPNPTVFLMLAMLTTGAVTILHGFHTRRSHNNNGYIFSFLTALVFFVYAFYLGLAPTNLFECALALSIAFFFLAGRFLYHTLPFTPSLSFRGRRMIAVALLVIICCSIFISFQLYNLENLGISLDAVLHIEGWIVPFSLGSGLALFTLILSAGTINRMRFEALRKMIFTDTQPVANGLQKQPIEQQIAGKFSAFQKDLEQNRATIKQISTTLQTATNNEKSLRNKYLSLISFTQQLDPRLDAPVTAQITALSLQKTLNCDLACVFIHSPQDKRLFPIAVAGTESTTIPKGFRLRPDAGLVGKALHNEKTLVAASENAETPALKIGGLTFQSQMILPLLSHGYQEGILLLADQRKHFFSPDDITLAEAFADRLLSAWRRTQVTQGLEDIIKAGQTLANINDLPTLLSRIADIARTNLKANFVFVTTLYKSQWQFGTSGTAPETMQSLTEPVNDALLELFTPPATLRIRDAQKDPHTSMLKINSAENRTMMVCPILNHGMAVGSILIFGHRNGAFFEEQDVFIGNVLAGQAASAIESCILSDDLRANLKSTQLLYNLSSRIDQADDLTTAARAIAETAYRMMHAYSCGIMLFSPSGIIEAQVMLGDSVLESDQPVNLIKQAMHSRQVIFLSESDTLSLMCYPLQTPRRCFGAIWLKIIETDVNRRTGHMTEELRILINQASVALERSILLVETRQQTDELASAYLKLEEIYDQTLVTLMSALDARDHETEGHCGRVTNIALVIGENMGLSASELKALERGSLLHDIGKIGISDAILHKPGPLNEAEWEQMREHPVIGAKMLEAIPFLRASIPVVASHQERWNGGGYPKGLKGEQIPVLARIFAVADVFDAILSERPYHEKGTPEKALRYVQSQAGRLLDPAVVATLEKIIVAPDFLKKVGYQDEKFGD